MGGRSGVVGRRNGTAAGGGVPFVDIPREPQIAPRRNNNSCRPARSFTANDADKGKCRRPPHTDERTETALEFDVPPPDRRHASDQQDTCDRRDVPDRIKYD